MKSRIIQIVLLVNHSKRLGRQITPNTFWKLQISRDTHVVKIKPGKDHVGSGSIDRQITLQWIYSMVDEGIPFCTKVCNYTSPICMLKNTCYILEVNDEATLKFREICSVQKQLAPIIWKPHSGWKPWPRLARRWTQHQPTSKMTEGFPNVWVTNIRNHHNGFPFVGATKIMGPMFDEFIGTPFAHLQILRPNICNFFTIVNGNERRQTQFVGNLRPIGQSSKQIDSSFQITFGSVNPDHRFRKIRHRNRPMIRSRLHCGFNSRIDYWNLIMQRKAQSVKPPLRQSNVALPLFAPLSSGPLLKGKGNEPHDHHSSIFTVQWRWIIQWQ